MRRISIYIIVILGIMITYTLYQIQLGSIPFLLFSFYFLYLAFKELQIGPKSINNSKNKGKS